MAEIVVAIGGLASTLLVPSLALGAWRRRQQAEASQKRQTDDDAGIVVLHEPENPDIDICFVHGLGGHRVKTWESTKIGSAEPCFWPTDFLAQDAQDAGLDIRVLSYGYKSFAPTPEYLTQRTLYRHSQQLISALSDRRKGCQKRPLIFVGHSLGGIVIMSALILSSQAQEPDQVAVQVSTSGVVFLGTPHEELLTAQDRSTWPRTLKSIVQLTRLGNSSLVNHLEKQSLSLQNKLQPFKALMQKIPTTAYYEGIRTPKTPDGLFLVPKPAHEPDSSYLEADHQGMAKFNDRDGKDFVKISREILRLCDASEERSRAGWKNYNEEKARNPDSNKYRKLIKDGDVETPDPQPVTPLPNEYHLEFQAHNKKFVGRAVELEFLRQTLCDECPSVTDSKSRTVNLYGTDGMGKSQIAREFAHANRDRFSAIFWIPAATSDSIQSGFLDIARTLRDNLDKTSSSNTRTSRILAGPSSSFEIGSDEERRLATINGVVEWFQSKANPSWLLILDNLDLSNDPDIANLIPSTSSSHGACIITSREVIDWERVTRYQVGPLNPQDSVSLLRASTGLKQADDRDLKDLSKALKYIPTALSAAAAYISSTKISLPEYLRRTRLDKEKVGALARHDSRRTEQRLVATVGKLTLPLSVSIFQICCVLSMESVCVSIFMSRSFKDQCHGDTIAAIRELQHHTLLGSTEDELDSTDDERFLTGDTRYLINQKEVLHRGLLLLSSEQVRVASQLACESALSVVRSLEEARDIKKGLDNCYAERDVAAVMERCFPLIDQHKPSSLDWAIDLDAMGQICERHGLIQVASQYFDLELNRSGGKNPALRKTKLRLALNRRLSRDNDMAESICAELISSDPESAVSNPPRTNSPEQQDAGDEVDVEALRLLRKLASEESNPEQELHLSKQIAAMQEHRLGPTHQATLEAVHELARDLASVGRYDEAEANIRRVLLSYKHMTANSGNAAGAEYIKTSAALELLASIRLQQGGPRAHAEAEELLERALSSHLARLGREHPTSQRCWAQLGRVYDAQRRHAHAEGVYAKCAASLAGTLGADHRETLLVREYRARNLARQGRHDEAQREVRGVLEMLGEEEEEASGRGRRGDARRRAAGLLVELFGMDPRAVGSMEVKVAEVEDRYRVDLRSRLGSLW